MDRQEQSTESESIMSYQGKLAGIHPKKFLRPGSKVEKGRGDVDGADESDCHRLPPQVGPTLHHLSHRPRPINSESRNPGPPPAPPTGGPMGACFSYVDPQGHQRSLAYGQTGLLTTSCSTQTLTGRWAITHVGPNIQWHRRGRAKPSTQAIAFVADGWAPPVSDPGVAAAVWLNRFPFPHRPPLPLLLTWRAEASLLSLNSGERRRRRWGVRRERDQGRGARVRPFREAAAEEEEEEEEGVRRDVDAGEEAADAGLQAAAAGPARRNQRRAARQQHHALERRHIRVATHAP